MMQVFVRRVASFLLMFCCCNSQLLVDYNIVPCNGDLSRLATLVWLQPAHCLFETWAAQTSSQSITDRSSTSITIEVLREDNNTFVLTRKYSIPPCTHSSPEPTEPAYRMGPSIACRNGSCIEHVLPGQAFRIRYIILDSSAKRLVVTSWSDAITTRDDPPSYHSIQVWNVGMQSAAMIVITVLLTVTIFILLVGLTVTISDRWN